MDQRVATMVEAVAACAEIPPWVLGPSVETLAAVHLAQRQLAALELGLIGQLHTAGVPAEQGASSTAVWLRNRMLTSVRVAGRQVRLATALAEAPAVLGEAVAAGAASIEQAEVIVAALAPLPAEVREAAAAELVRFCAELDPQALTLLGARILDLVAPEIAERAAQRALAEAEQRAYRQRYLTLTPDQVGVAIRGRLTAEQAAVVRAAIEPLTKPLPDDERTAEQRRADALEEVCRLALATDALPDNGGARPQIVVTTHFDVLTRQLGAGTLDTGDTLTPETVRRLCCDAALLPAVLDGAGQPLDFARERRLIGGALRRALVLRDEHCAFPGCERPPRWCDGHHVIPWHQGGPTNLNNSVLLCGFHHREIHRPGSWTVHIATDGRPTFVPPTWIDPQQQPRRNQYHRRQ